MICSVISCANEFWSALVFHFAQHAPAWGAPGQTAYLILIGLNIEICFMFAIAGTAFGKMLPPYKKAKILGIPNELVVAAADLPVRLSHLLPDLVLGLRHGERQEQGGYSGRDVWP